MSRQRWIDPFMLRGMSRRIGGNRTKSSSAKDYFQRYFIFHSYIKCVIHISCKLLKFFILQRTANLYQTWMKNLHVNYSWNTYGLSKCRRIAKVWIAFRLLYRYTIPYIHGLYIIYKIMIKLKSVKSQSTFPGDIESIRHFSARSK